MGSYGNLDTNNWTPSFVSANRAECMRTLRTLNSTVETLIREKNFPDAIVGMKKISIGLIKMENEKIADFGKQLVLLALMMPAVAILGILDIDAPESSRRKTALQYALEMATNPNHELAACYQIAQDDVHSYIADLKSGAPLAQIKRKYNFPADVFDALRDLDRDFSRFSSSYASSVSFPPPSVSSPPMRSSAPSARPIGWIAIVLLLAAIVGVLFFCASSFIKAEPPAPSSNVQQTKAPPEDMPEPDPSNGFIFPNSDTELIEPWEVEALSDSDLTYAINEIYARHGYIFRSAELSEYYGQFPWYTGITSSEEFSVDCFNQIEKQNWNLLVQERNSRREAG